MGELLYEDMIPAQAADALDEFVVERSPALEQLRSTMAAHRFVPEALLDGTPESTRPAWKWMTAQADELGVDPRPPAHDPTRPA